MPHRAGHPPPAVIPTDRDRKSTRLNSSHLVTSYAVPPDISTLSLHDALPISLISKPFHGERSPALSPRSSDSCKSTIVCEAILRPLELPLKSTSSYDGTCRTAPDTPHPR